MKTKANTLKLEVWPGNIEENWLPKRIMRERLKQVREWLQRQERICGK